MSAQSEFRSLVESERPYLMRYAALQLRDTHSAEDAVQETLLAALSGEDRFAGRSNLRTWLTGILKHKIVDVIRRTSREVASDPVTWDDLSDFDPLFDAKGHWVAHPDAWPNPDAALEQRQFFSVLEDCLTKLPRKTSQAFMMREHLGSSTEEICAALGVTATHCGVLLYRARMALQRCLDSNWFAK